MSNILIKEFENNKYQELKPCASSAENLNGYTEKDFLSKADCYLEQKLLFSEEISISESAKTQYFPINLTDFQEDFILSFYETIYFSSLSLSGGQSNNYSIFNIGLTNTSFTRSVRGQSGGSTYSIQNYTLNNYFSVIKQKKNFYVLGNQGNITGISPYFITTTIKNFLTINLQRYYKIYGLFLKNFPE